MTAQTPFIDDLISLLIRSRRTNGQPLPAGEAARADAVWRLVADRFDAEPAPAYRQALAAFERQPARNQEAFRHLLEDLLRRDPEFAAGLDRAARLPTTPYQTFHAPVGQLTTIDRAETVVIAPATGRNAPDGPPPLPPPLEQLHARLIASFNRDELMDVALAMGLLPESIPGDTIQAYARGLILACWRDGTLDRLAAEAGRLRPDGDWRLDTSALPDAPPDEFSDVPAVRQTTIINQAGTVKNIRSIFSDTRQVLAVVAVVLAVAALAGAAIWNSRQPRRMDGEFNVAVAQVKLAADDENAVYGPIITQQITSILNQELDSFSEDVQVSDHNMGVVNDTRDAERLADRANAHVVVYGEAEVFNETVRFTPHFYVNDTAHAAMFEVNGSDFLEDAIVVDKSSLEQEPPDTRLIAARAALLVDFTRALVYLAFDNLPSAAAEIESAVRRAETDDWIAGLSGYEVIYLYASQIARLGGDLPAAEAYAQRALDVSDDAYARGYIALGNILYDEGNLAAAYEAYQNAMALPAAPEDLIDAKASLGLGNLALSSMLAIGAPDCQGEEQGRVTEGVSRYREVIAAFETAGGSAEADERLSVLAGQAWTGIGKIRQLCGERAAAVDAYRAALEFPLPQGAEEEVHKLLAELGAEEG